MRLNTDRMTRLAPDPVAAILCVVSALASVASIAALNWISDEEPGDRAQNRRKPRNTLRDLQQNCLALRDVLNRLDRNLQLFSSDTGSITTPIKFGVHAIQVPHGSAALHQEVVSDIARLFDETSRNAFEVMALIGDGIIDPTEDLYFRFAEVQERLNVLLVNRSGLRETLIEGVKVAETLAVLVAALKSESGS